MKKTKLSFEKKTSNALKANRIIHRVTFNPNGVSLGEVLRVPVPRFDEDVVLLPGSLSFIFNLKVSAEANGFLVNNESRTRFDRRTVTFEREIVQGTDDYDLFKFYDDLSFTESERESMFREGIQSEDLSKIRCKAGDEKTSGVDKENKVIDV